MARQQGHVTDFRADFAIDVSKALSGPADAFLGPNGKPAIANKLAGSGGKNR